MSLVIPFLFSIAIARVNAQVTAISVEPVGVAEHPAQAIWVDPNSYLTSPELDTLKSGDTFTVDVFINISLPLSAGATGMFGWQYILFWEESNVNLTNWQTHIPEGWEGFSVADKVGIWNSTEQAGDYPERDGQGYHMYAYACITGTPFTGVMSLCTYDFHVIKAIYKPSDHVIGFLDFEWVKFMDDSPGVIPMNVYNGEYRIVATSRPSEPLAVGNIVLVVVVAIFFVIALYYVKKRILK